MKILLYLTLFRGAIGMLVWSVHLTSKKDVVTVHITKPDQLHRLFWAAYYTAAASYFLFIS